MYKQLLALIVFLMLNSCENSDNPVIQENTQQNPNIIDVEQARPGESGELVETIANIGGAPRKVTLSKHDNFYVYQGDIVIPSDHVGMTDDRSCIKTSGKWPNSTIYYHIRNDVHNESIIRQAIQHWEETTPIRFIESTSQHFVEFKPDAEGCWSNVGRVISTNLLEDIGEFLGVYEADTKQYIGLADWATVGTVIHEIGHTVGLEHEHTRADRDDFVVIHENNIESGEAHNFAKNSDSKHQDVGPFDFNSIMLYHSWAFGIESSTTITRLDGSTFFSQRSGLSATDILGVVKLHGGGIDIFAKGDFDGDNVEEIVYKFKNSTKIFLSQNGTRNLGECVYDGTYHAEKFLVGDFDGDGDDDILTKFKNLTKVYHSDNARNLVATQSYIGSYHVSQWCCGDFNGDGRDEILTAFKNLPKVYYTQQASNLVNAKSYEGSYHVEKFLVGDFDGDGDDDILTKFENLTKVYHNDNARNLVAAKSYTGSYHVSQWCSGDFNGDGKYEILTAFKNLPKVYYTQQASNLVNAKSYEGSYHAEKFLVGDFDGDGDDDILTKFGNLTKVYHNDNARNLVASKGYSGSYSINNWLSGDFDGDGNDEILSTFKNLTKVYYSNSASNIVATHTMY